MNISNEKLDRFDLRDGGMDWLNPELVSPLYIN